ncbi:MAG: malto-oligosyltrehalose trehalohydrolase [Rhizobiales bacterium 62-47]|nr:malto-oligosyltrehalose trehalohydrolase [Hyphomicrobiales bacterium]OJY11513.1 MAG: malto-oligosyltrehalose trehalohydrolase [Rhizobiales bacterium 62-47]
MKRIQPSIQTSQFGTTVSADGVHFRLWAPRQETVSIVIERQSFVLHPILDGWHEIFVPHAKASTLYQYRLADGQRVPDPASRFQPFDVHGPSEVIDPACYAWNDQGWRGRPWEEAVIYELHVGTFTPRGTFLSAIKRFDWLVELGITAIEIMPVADFPGERNWGYDGVLLFAPDSSYGRPEDLKALIDAAHARNIMVFLDVVYNHFGPEGNYLPLYAPIFTEHHNTPWGAAVNYDAAGSSMVRAFAVDNAAYWIEEFHFDGLRLDAVHNIHDDSGVHILDDVATRVRQLGLARPIHLILENEDNDPRRLQQSPSGQPVHYTAQWNDDIHHVLHVAATGEETGYYLDYKNDTDKLGRSLAEGFAFQGEFMTYRNDTRGHPSGRLSPTSFVAFIQNHDQIGNRAFGDRLTSLAPSDAVRAIAAIYLLLPQVPMIFMGEEFAASTPFQFFCDFGPDLAKAVREGRRNEFAKFPEFRDPAMRDRIPDPTSRQTFLASKLNWSRVSEPYHAEWARLYRELIAIRHREIVPRLREIGPHAGRYVALDTNVVMVNWTLNHGARLNLIANLSPRPFQHSIALSSRKLWSAGLVASHLAPWGVVWTFDD